MADSGLARRVVLRLDLDGVDISADINKYLLSFSYTDNEEDKADDISVTIDDRDSEWIGAWGDSLKGAELYAAVIQKNWESDGGDRVLDCGVFELDTIDLSGPPQTVSIKGTSLPYSGTARTQTTTRAWENIKLSAIANEIAGKHGLTCMFESSYDPLYKRREQVQLSDIVFLQGLCKDAGVSLKVTAKIIVLFDESKYEGKPAITDIKRGTSDVLSYRFSSASGDVKYTKCHVSYTDPQTGKTIEYTYTPRDSDKDGEEQILEINEKVRDREEARQLAMKRLRQKNKSEYEANFSLVGDVRLVAGVTVNVIGWGIFDGRYIIETATHDFTGGYTVGLKLRRALEGY
jgi:phage protein D